VVRWQGTDVEACRACVESLKMRHGHSKVSDVMTVNAGVATMVPDGDTSRRTLVEAADKALYRAKAAGRNRVVLESTPRQSIQLCAIARP